MSRFKKLSILKNDFHFIWIVLFFIINGYNHQNQTIPFADLLFLFIILTTVSIFFFWIAFKFFKSFKKAGVLTSFVLILVLFFGVLQDALGTVRFLAFISSLTLFLSIVLALIVFLIVWIRYTKRRFNRTTIFINALFQLYILVEIVFLIQGLMPRQKQIQLADRISFDSSSKPDVYLIVLDEYFGSTGLREYFGYDNSEFEQFLTQKGFKVLSNTRSNYVLTLFSMASMLNIDYLKNLKAVRLEDSYSYKVALSGIESNIVIEKFREAGYRIRNLSRFNMHNAPSDYATGLLPSKTQLINSKTLYYRVGRHLPFFLAKHGLDRFAEIIHNESILKNRKMMRTTLEKAVKRDSVPIFTYMQLLMPHEPYAFDSTGRRITPFWQRKSYTLSDKDKAYLQYLVYTNKVIGNYVQQLLKATNGKAVILLMSDHGYRDAGASGYKDIFQTLNAVYVPGKSNSGWYNGMTNVNQFRVLFNTLFNAQLPLLKDSIIN